MFQRGEAGRSAHTSNLPSAGEQVSKVVVLSTDGELLLAWNSSTLEMPHGIFLANAASPNPTVWITDVGNGPHGHSVKQYSPSGKLLQVIAFPLVVSLTLILNIWNGFAVLMTER